MSNDNLDYYSEPLPGFKFTDRRRKTLRNRLRRSLNNYWLIPVFILYLEFFTVLVPPMDSPMKNLLERNLNFLKGPVILYNLASTDFPYTLIGHFKEIAIVKKYSFNISQVPSGDIVRTLDDREGVREIYRRLIESRNYNNTEIGGIATVSYGHDGPKLHLHEITSINMTFSERLHKAADSSPSRSIDEAIDEAIDEVITLLQKRESREIVARVEIDEHLVDQLIDVLLSNKVSMKDKTMLIEGFVKRYDTHSELKYVLSPYDFKSFLGSAELEGEYIGIFHFHNNYMEPPSEIDVANSFTDRQIVITPSDGGFMLYDIIKGKEHTYEAGI